MKKFWSDFKKFAFKGNVVDMAVGVIIGSAFSKIVTSLVNDILMPVLGAMTGGVNFSEMKYVIGDTTLADDTPAAIAYGSFIQNIIDFFIIGICVFMMIKVVSKVSEKMKKEEEAAPAPVVPKGPTQEELLMEIRDLLKEQNK